MHKIMICLERPEIKPEKEFKDEIEKTLLNYLDDFSAIRYTLIDEGVMVAKSYEIINTVHPKDAIISVWREQTQGLENFYGAIKQLTDRFQVYQVMERQPILAVQKTGRVEGMCQIAFLQQPQRLSRKEWLDIWLNSHADIAIEIQSTFCYRQNIVVVPEEPEGIELSWPIVDAIVEENFPDTAMSNRAAFFDSADDEERYKKHELQMVESCSRFIDFDKFDCVPMSEYIIK